MNPKLKRLMYNLLGPYPKNPSCEGIYYHDNKAVIVGDHIMFEIVGVDYPKEHEGKSIAKDGSILEGVFPKYELAIKGVQGLPDPVSISFTSLSRQLLEEGAEAQEITIQGVRLDVNLLLKVLKVFHNLEEDAVLYPGRVGDSYDPAQLYSMNCRALIMPLI